MTDDTNKPWLIDGRSGRVITRAELLARINRQPASVRLLCQPTSTADGLMEVAAAIAHGFDLTLFDADSGPQEIAALGYSPAHLHQPAPVAAPSTVTTAKLAQQAAGGSRSRLGLFTSGSTGLPKLVWQTVANLARAVKVSPRHAEAVWAFAYNPTHVAGIQVYLQALANGCPVVDVYGLDRAGVLAAIGRHGVTHISATPSFYRLLLPVDKTLPGVCSVTLGGESSDAALLERLRPLFPSARFHNVYASTEAGTLLTADGDIFSIAAGLEKLVVLRDGKIHVHRSLLGEFEATAKPTPVTGNQLSVIGISPTENASQPITNIQQPITTSSLRDDDWYDTGDVVEIVSTEPLRFRIVARERDWVNVGGSKVNPHEVEAVLGEHPGIKQVRVFGRKNSVMGNILCAEIELPKVDDGRQSTDGSLVTEAALREFAAARLQPFKVPRLIRFVENIAQTRTGKISRQ